MFFNLQQALQQKPFSSQFLLDVLKENVQLRRNYSDSVGVWEGLSLEKHTLMVLNQFEKYFSDMILPGNFNQKLFRLMLALHDIGKPEALRQGDKWKQHRISTEIIQSLASYLPFSVKEVMDIITFVNGDPIGSYLRGRLSLEESINLIQYMNQKCSYDLNDFFNLMIIYYQVDAGSYTKDAGGLPILDSIFQKEETTGRFLLDVVRKRLIFASEVAEKFHRFEEKLFI